METVMVHPTTKEQSDALTAFLKELKVEFEVSTYNPEFVSKIKASKKQAKEGKTVSITLDEIWPG
jgi:hypothetical protein